MLAAAGIGMGFVCKAKGIPKYWPRGRRWRVSGGLDSPASSASHIAAHGELMGHHLDVIAPVASTDLYIGIPS